MESIEDYFPTQYTNLARISIGTRWKYPNDMYWNIVTDINTRTGIIYYISSDQPGVEQEVLASANKAVIVRITNSCVTSLNKELIGEYTGWPKDRVVSKG